MWFHVCPALLNRPLPGSAAYDAERTADLFCHVCNVMHDSFLRAEEKARALGWKDGAPAPLDLLED